MAATAASASPGPAGASAWLEAADGRASGLLRLSSARTISGGADILSQTWTETWTLAIDPSCKGGDGSSRVLWRDERSWQPMAMTVTPGVGRLFVRPERHDILVILTSVEGTRWGVVACVDVFRVTFAEVASPTTRATAKPLARLAQPCGENNWRLADVHGRAAGGPPAHDSASIELMRQ